MNIKYAYKKNVNNFRYLFYGYAVISGATFAVIDFPHLIHFFLMLFLMMFSILVLFVYSKLMFHTCSIEAIDNDFIINKKSYSLEYILQMVCTYKSIQLYFNDLIIHLLINEETKKLIEEKKTKVIYHYDSKKSYFKQKLLIFAQMVLLIYLFC